MTDNEMVRWHHQLDGHEFQQAPGVGDGQGGLAFCEAEDTETKLHPRLRSNLTNQYFLFMQMFSHSVVSSSL